VCVSSRTVAVTSQATYSVVGGNRTGSLCLVLVVMSPVGTVEY